MQPSQSSPGQKWQLQSAVLVRNNKIPHTGFQGLLFLLLKCSWIAAEAEISSLCVANLSHSWYWITSAVFVIGSGTEGILTIKWRNETAPKAFADKTDSKNKRGWSTLAAINIEVIQLCYVFPSSNASYWLYYLVDTHNTSSCEMGSWKCTEFNCCDFNNCRQHVCPLENLPTGNGSSAHKRQGRLGAIHEGASGERGHIKNKHINN